MFGVFRPALQRADTELTAFARRYERGAPPFQPPSTTWVIKTTGLTSRLHDQGDGAQTER